jgi:hypothetical protein
MRKLHMAWLSRSLIYIYIYIYFDWINNKLHESFWYWIYKILFNIQNSSYANHIWTLFFYWTRSCYFIFFIHSTETNHNWTLFFFMSPNMVSVAVVFIGLFFSKMSEAMVQIYFRRYLLIFYQIVQKELWNSTSKANHIWNLSVIGHEACYFLFYFSVTNILLSYYDMGLATSTQDCG